MMMMMMRTLAARRAVATASAPLASSACQNLLQVGQGGATHATLSPHSARAFSSYSSFSEPDPTLFLRQLQTVHADDADEDVDAPLRNDIRVMGSLLGKIIQQHEGYDIFEKVETLRNLAKTWRRQQQESGQTSSLQELADTVSQFTDKELFLVSRAFTHFLAIANAAEGHHRIRRLHDSQYDEEAGALFPKPDSCGGVLHQLRSSDKNVHDIWQTLSQQTTEFVLTAHPTEVNRRTILDKKRRIHAILTKASSTGNKRSTLFERKVLDDALYREIASIWLSDEVSRQKPTPEKEAEKGTLVLETVLWEAVPQFLRKLDITAREFLDNKGLPLSSNPVRFASWMGGDRDGNPNVKPQTTRVVCYRNRAKAAGLFVRDLMRLESELSITTASAELLQVLEGPSREPYRAFLKPMIEKLKRTEKWAERKLKSLEKSSRASESSKMDDDAVTEDDIYLSKDTLMNELLLIHKSLCDTGNEVVANGILTDVIRNVAAFGLTLIPLDVRQESDRHEEAVDAITRFLGLGSYAQWDEQTRISWITSQLSSKRPLLRPGIWHEFPEIFSDTSIDTLETFRMIAEQQQYGDSLGAYVISQATSASDVLAVLLLQIDAGVKKPLRVVPLFETLSDLNGSADTMRTLFSLPVYMGIINGKQEVMIGYSDSAKDAGRLAAVWAQFENQEKLAAIAREFSVNLTFFHGKGGTVGRGGNPQTFHAIMAHAPNTINGYFRVTEQGEMIHQNFGHGDRAERTMDIYTAGVLAERLNKRASAPPQPWRDMMQNLSDISCNAYRRVVRGDPRFVPYFRSATPEVELASLNIGSRPAKRKATGGVESLRAIPWNFAWTQTRSNLPTWLGVGEALETVLKGPDADLLHEMYNEWDTFRTTVDLVEMVLAKSDPAIAKHYDDMLVEDGTAKQLGSEIRSLHLATEQALLDLTQHSVLGENNLILQRALAVRNPYVDCLNVLQAETLKRIRNCEEGKEGKDLKDALMTTITGIANGMGNTG